MSILLITVFYIISNTLKPQDYHNLINYIKLKVFEHYKISLEVEPKIISWSNL